MNKKLMRRLGILNIILFSLAMIGLTLFEIYSDYFNIFREIGALMVILGIVGLVFMFIYNKVKKINMTKFYKEVEKPSVTWSLILALVFVFFGFSIGFGKFGEPDFLFFIPKYLIGFLAGLIGIFLIIMIIHNQIKKKRNV